MLNHLKISNYVLINELELTLDKGFSIITGETGAGKSILLGALSLLMGARTDISTLKDDTKKCIVEGTFKIGSYNLQGLFQTYDIDWEDETLIRREIFPSGKSRTFINDTPVSLKNLRDITSYLIDIHSQNESLALSEKSYQLEFVDLYSGIIDEVEAFSQQFDLLAELKQKYHNKQKEINKSKKELDYLQFQYNQLEEANLKLDEQQELEVEQETLANADELKQYLSKIEQTMSNEEISIEILMRDALSSLNKAASLSSEFRNLYERLNSCFVELQDIGGDIGNAFSSIEADPSKLEIISQRLDTIYSLQQKHQVSSIQELICYRESLKAKIENISSSDDILEEMQKEIEEATLQLKMRASILSDKRKEVLPILDEKVTLLIRSLGMENAIFHIDMLSNFDNLNSRGGDEITFLFSANKNQKLNDLSRVASGGELSRVMLAIKYILSHKKSLATLLFDEIDTGISGKIADSMASILKEMSENLQVINITHLPQVACKGDYHFWVYKSDTFSETNTHIKLLNREERICEIAKMLSGKDVTEASLENAKSLLNHNN